MTASPSSPPQSKSTSRRALLAGALGGLGALAASAIGRAGPVRAGVDGDVVLGTTNGATTATSIINSSNTNPVFEAASATGGEGVIGSSSSGHGVKGTSLSNAGVFGFSSSGAGVYGQGSTNYGVSGVSSSNAGVYGTSSSGFGVYGQGNTNAGVAGFSSATDQPASVGLSGGNSTGVQGASGSLPAAARAKTGVYGYAAQDNFSRGVTGESPAGIGVYGISSTGYGVYSAGVVYTTRFYELTEISTPVSPVANRARLFAKDNGLGKTQLCVKFANGTVKILATEG